MPQRGGISLQGVHVWQFSQGKTLLFCLGDAVTLYKRSEPQGSNRISPCKSSSAVILIPQTWERREVPFFFINWRCEEENSFNVPESFITFGINSYSLSLAVKYFFSLAGDVFGEQLPAGGQQLAQHRHLQLLQQPVQSRRQGTPQVRCTEMHKMKEFHNGDRGCENFEMWLRLLKEWLFEPNCLNCFLKSLSVWVEYHPEFPTTSISGVEFLHCIQTPRHWDQTGESRNSINNFHQTWIAPSSESLYLYLLDILKSKW